MKRAPAFWLYCAYCAAAGWVLGAALTGCAWLQRNQPDPAASAYGVERMRCVTDHDAAAEAAACMKAIDKRYSPLRDGGL